MTNKHIKERLFEIVDECKTQREAADRLGTYEQYLQVLTRRYGIVKWRRKNYIPKKIKTETKICQECGEAFTKETQHNHNPGRFCSKKCQGRWLGTTYGFGSKFF